MKPSGCRPEIDTASPRARRRRQRRRDRKSLRVAADLGAPASIAGTRGAIAGALAALDSVAPTIIAATNVAPAVCALIIIALTIVGLAGAVAAAEPTSLPEHPFQQAYLAADATFPRFTPAELQSGGFPDHMHVERYPGYLPLEDAAGRRIGPRSICGPEGYAPPPELVVCAGDFHFGNLLLRADARFAPCVLAPFLEYAELAYRDVTGWLDLTAPDTLLVLNATRVEDYTDWTGQGIWRLYQWHGSSCVIEPVPTLRARTLVGHAAYQVVVEWILDRNGGERLPAWLRAGLVEYLSEDGVHLVNYMAEFRHHSEVLVAPAWADSILAAPPDPDPMQDRQLFRVAAYNAFLMVWELIENRGGLASMRRLLHLVAAGADAGTALREVYGQNPAALMASLDARERGEPIGAAIEGRTPHKPPENWQAFAR